MKTHEQIINRLETIERKLAREGRNYDHSARHSQKWLMAATAIRNLEPERSMLETALRGMLQAA